MPRACVCAGRQIIYLCDPVTTDRDRTLGVFVLGVLIPEEVDYVNLRTAEHRVWKRLDGQWREELVVFP